MLIRSLHYVEWKVMIKVGSSIFITYIANAKQNYNMFKNKIENPNTKEVIHKGQKVKVK